MKKLDLNKIFPGTLTPIDSDNYAYNPKPLPPNLKITWKLAILISNADRSIAELAGVAGNLPNPHLLIDPFIKREATASSRIEGTQSGLSDLLYFEAAPVTQKPNSDAFEISNYIKALGACRRTSMSIF